MLFDEFVCFAGLKGWVLVIVFYLTVIGFGFVWGYIKGKNEKGG